jgi:hypothetical protein
MQIVGISAERVYKSRRGSQSIKNAKIAVNWPANAADATKELAGAASSPCGCGCGGGSGGGAVSPDMKNMTCPHDLGEWKCPEVSCPDVNGRKFDLVTDMAPGSAAESGTCCPVQTCVKRRSNGCDFGNVVITAIVSNRYNLNRNTPWFKVMCGSEEATLGKWNTFFLPNNNNDPYKYTNEAWGTIACCDIQDGERVSVVSTSDQNKVSVGNRLLVSMRRRNADGTTGDDYAFATSEVHRWQCGQSHPDPANPMPLAWTPARSKATPHRAFEIKYEEVTL